MLRRPLIMLSAVLLTFLPMAHAQLRNHDAYFGYSRTGSDLFYPNTGGLNGWQAALHIHLKPFLGVEGDVAHYGLGADSAVPRSTTVMVGPRVTVKALGFGIFAHGLIGGEHSSNPDGTISGGSMTYALGGGVDIPILPFFAWRIAGDHIASPTLSPADSTKARFNTGLVFRF